MNKIKPETLQEHLERLAFAALTMTQDQIDACAWAMGASACGWNRNNLNESIKQDIEKQKGISSQDLG